MIRQAASSREPGMKSKAAHSITSPGSNSYVFLTHPQLNSIVTNRSSAPDIASMTLHHWEYRSPSQACLGDKVACLRILDLNGIQFSEFDLESFCPQYPYRACNSAPLLRVSPFSSGPGILGPSGEPASSAYSPVQLIDCEL